MNKRIIVIPCYNEEGRLQKNAVRELLDGDVSLLFVNDGSTDKTWAMLQAVNKQYPEQTSIIDLPKNVGKGEAVRAGLLKALSSDPEFVGYADADMATPPAEVLRLFKVFAAVNDQVLCVMGSRVRLLGTQIQRRKIRHYLGRLFATVSSLLLGVDVYDTQCGAKIFRNTPYLRQALEQPFRSRWIFDVEIIGRLIRAAGCTRDNVDRRMIEVPLRSWQDMSGSKLRLRHAPAIFRDLIVLWRTLRA